MNDFRIRPVTLDDAVAVNDLLAASEAVDHTEEHYSVADVVEELENPMIHRERDWVVVERDGQLVGHSRLMPRAPADGVLRVSIDGTVHPEHRRRGIGSHVIPLMIQRAHDYVSERGDLRPVISGDGLSTDTDLAAVFARNGLHPHRWAFVMEADLAAVSPAPPLPDGYALSTWEGVDHDELRAAHNQAFIGHPGFSTWSAEMWSQWVEDSRNFRPALSLVARDESGAVAAYIQTAEFDAVEEATGVREAYVGKVGTLPAYRRRGLAGVLLRIALERYRDAGFHRAALDVDSENPTGALGIYEQAGFRTTLRWTNYLLGAEPQ